MRRKALSPLLRPVSAGDAAAVARVLATSGSIGFAASPDAEAGGATTLRLQDNGQKPALEATYASPAAGAAANCPAMTYRRPAGGGGLDLDWSAVFGAKPAMGGGAYPLCMLTYVLAVHGYEAAGFAVGQGSTVKDYVNGYVVTPPVRPRSKPTVTRPRRARRRRSTTSSARLTRPPPRSSGSSGQGT